MIKILFICHGNICRSPMAEFVFLNLVKKAGCESEFEIDSAATSREEIGNPVHPGTLRKLVEQGVPVREHRARQMTRQDYQKYDYLIGMDAQNLRNMLRILGGDPEGKVYKFLSFSGSGRDIEDPWYTGNFDETYDDVIEGCEGFLKYLKEHGELHN